MNGRAGGARREAGSRDWRMVPVAVTIWAASLIGHTSFDALMAGTRAEPGGHEGIWWPAVVAAVTSAGMVMAAACVSAPLRRHRAWAAWASVIGCAMLASLASTWCAELTAWHDPVSVRVRDGPVSVVADVAVTAPVMASDIHGADCQTDVVIRTATFEGVTMRSTATARLYAQDVGCIALERDARYRVVGTVEAARFGTPDVWLAVDDDAIPEAVSRPPWWSRTRTAMQEALFTATEPLSDQGRMLVPGLTLGMLGSEQYRTTEKRDFVDPTYAASLEQRFRQSGIMHLMAVSGGHFVLVAALIRRLCAMALAHRYVVAAATACAYLMLAALVYPSDSVTRALIMGLLGAAATALGRRAQAMSALGWTVSAALIMKPSLAASYGFALSCAAVFGIVSCATIVSRHLERVLPRPLAAATGMTVAAQMFTLPIQILMEPEIPVMSIPANLIVAPVVGMATMAGLGALLLAWLNMDIGVMLTRIAASGTRMMEVCAMWLGDDDRAALPWVEGPPGAALALAVELLAILIILTAERLREHQANRRHAKEPTGESWRPWRHRYEMIGLWLAQTPAVFGSWADSSIRRGPRR